MLKCACDVHGVDVNETQNSILVPSGVGFVARGWTAFDSGIIILRDIINHGNAYNNIPGYFTAPLGGVYVFRLRILHEVHTNWGNRTTPEIKVEILVNGKMVCSQQPTITGWNRVFYTEDVCSAIVRLEPGDLVRINDLAAFKSDLVSPEEIEFSGFLYMSP